MRSFRTLTFIMAFMASLFTVAVISNRAVRGQSKDDSKLMQPDSPQIVAGEVEARKLLLLMDTDKSGKVSRDEFMRFMVAEFDRLDINKDGELDVKELSKSQLMTVHRGGVHR